MMRSFSHVILFIEVYPKNFDSFQGAAGRDGMRGNQGCQGATGIPGQQGPAGRKGAKGEAGQLIDPYYFTHFLLQNNAQVNRDCLVPMGLKD